MDAALKFRATASHMAAPREPRELCFRRMFETAPIGMAICGLDGQVVEINAALAAILGYELKEAFRVDLWNQSDQRKEREGSGEGQPDVTEPPTPDSLEGLVARRTRDVHDREAMAAAG